ncbi:homocysteine biosynthesis protein, partial [candidate division KSB1 bacterium]|nr:homocysteine biosynthesis protein [candidate division KSB1 bacterium]
RAVVVTADEMCKIVEQEGVKKTAQKVDVVTTGTFGPMCSSGVFINFGHTRPRIRATKVWLNDVPAYAGIAAVDCYIGATELKDHPDDQHPDMKYGGAHVIHDLVRGETVVLRAKSYGTDCYPLKETVKKITIKEISDAMLFNPRNAYQNYNVAVNKSDRKIFTYMGVLKPNLGNATYCSSGQLSPLLNDPHFRTIGVGTRIFLGGGIGYVVGPGTQHNPCLLPDNKVSLRAGGTLAVSGDLKQMSPVWLKGAHFPGYGVSMRVGLGIPIPILDEDMVLATAVNDQDITAPVVDYSQDYPQGLFTALCRVSYAQLRSGYFEMNNKKIPTAGLSSYRRALEIAEILKLWIQEGHFLITQPVEHIPI